MFTVFSKAVLERYTEMAKGELFTTDAEDLFEKYLAAYPEGSNPTYRTRTVYDCSCCKQFVRRIGTVVAIKDHTVQTVWDVDVPSPYKEVAAEMRKAILAANITGVFRTKERRYGLDHNYDEENTRHDHFVGEVAARHLTPDPGTKIGEKAAVHQVLSRGLNQIKVEHLNLVLDLIKENGLYRGAEFKPAIEGFKDLLRKFNFHINLRRGESEIFVWSHLDDRNACFRNTAIGTLLVDLAEGKAEDEAVRAFEKKVAPENYKRPTAVITQRMVEDAQQALTDSGLGPAIYRRFAKLSDVSVADVLFVSNDGRAKMKGGIAQLLASSVATPKVNARQAATITNDTFVRDVLNGACDVKLMLENRHSGNFVSLTAPRDDGDYRLFKWDNNFAWSYDGDVTDSVKQRVKAAGGKIDCKLRVSLSWFNYDDLDLHAVTPSGGHVFFGNKAGILDVDMNAHSGKTRSAVENLAFNQLQDGVYKIHVNQFCRRETVDVGFAIEVEYGGELRQFSYPRPVSGDVPCLQLTVAGGKLVSIDRSNRLTEGSTSKEKWGVKTETLVPVTAVLYSPNHWGENRAGARHTIFALEGCLNPDATRGIYNEYLRGDMERHRKVLEVLGAKTKCPPSSEQVSGVGFTAARGDSVTVVVDGRPYLVSF